MSPGEPKAAAYYRSLTSRVRVGVEVSVSFSNGLVAVATTREPRHHLFKWN